LAQELERVYTINLGKVLLSVNTHRAPRAINMIREFARHHMKIQDIRIEEDLAHQIWARGVRSPPRKIRVRMSKTDEGYVLVSPYTDDIVAKEPDKKGKKGSGDKKGKKDSADKEVKVEPVTEVKTELTSEVKTELASEVKTELASEVKIELASEVKTAPAKQVKSTPPQKKSTPPQKKSTPAKK